MTIPFMKSEKELEEYINSLHQRVPDKMDNNWVPKEVFTSVHDSETLRKAVNEWMKLDNDDAKEDYDSVVKPSHYMLFEDLGIEVRDVIEKLAANIYEWHSPNDGAPLLVSDYVQMMQYLMRFMNKNGVEDLKKARWYLDKLIDAYEPDL